MKNKIKKWPSLPRAWMTGKRLGKLPLVLGWTGMPRSLTTTPISLKQWKKSKIKFLVFWLTRRNFWPRTTFTNWPKSVTTWTFLLWLLAWRMIFAMNCLKDPSISCFWLRRLKRWRPFVGSVGKKPLWICGLLEANQSDKETRSK